MSLRQNASAINSTLQSLKRDHQDLIDLFETPLNENERLLSIGIADFNQFAEEIEVFFKNEIQELIVNQKILQLQENEQFFKNYEKQLKIKNLYKDGTFQTFWVFYSGQVNKINTKLSYSILSYESLKIFIAMKLKSLDTTLQTIDKNRIFSMLPIHNYEELDKNYYRMTNQFDSYMESGGKKCFSYDAFQIKSQLDLVGMALMLLEPKKVSQVEQLVNLSQASKEMIAYVYLKNKK